MALPLLIPIMIAGVRYLVPKIAAKAIKTAAKTSTQAATKLAKKAAEGVKKTAATTQKVISGTGGKKRLNARNNRTTDKAELNPVGTATGRTKSGQLKTVSKKRVENAQKQVNKSQQRKAIGNLSRAATVASLASVLPDTVKKSKKDSKKVPSMGKPITVKVRKEPKKLIEPKVDQPKVKVKPKAPKPEEKAPYGTNLFGFALGDPDKPDEPDFFDESTSVDDLEQYDKDIAAYNKRKGLRKGGKVGKKKAGCRAGYGKAMRGY